MVILLRLIVQFHLLVFPTDVQYTKFESICFGYLTIQMDCVYKLALKIICLKQLQLVS